MDSKTTEVNVHLDSLFTGAAEAQVPLDSGITSDLFARVLLKAEMEGTVTLLGSFAVSHGDIAGLEGAVTVLVLGAGFTGCAGFVVSHGDIAGLGPPLESWSLK
jgi:hypothetical protein